MISRRGLFSLLSAAPVAAIAPAAAARSSEPAKPTLATGQVPTCECGHQFVTYRAWETRPGSKLYQPGTGYMKCGNPGCKLNGRKFALPTVELKPADPAEVARVDAEHARTFAHVTEIAEYKSVAEIPATLKPGQTAEIAYPYSWRVSWEGSK